MRRRLVLLLLTFASSPALACDPPNNTPVTRCKNHPLEDYDPWTCEVTAAVLEKRSGVYFETGSRNEVATVWATLRVEKGTLRVVYRDTKGEPQNIDVVAGTESKLEMKTKLNDKRSFGLTLEPVGGNVEGFSATVHYASPPSGS